MEEYQISGQMVLDLIFWARRYCDGRATYAPSEFNRIYNEIKSKYPNLVDLDTKDKALMDEGIYWPYAQDGMYDEKTGAYDARI